MSKQLKPTHEQPSEAHAGATGPSSSPMAIAQIWISRVLTVSLEMVVPGLIGIWLDSRFDSSPWLTLAGFAVGMPFGFWHLLLMTRSTRKGK